jgi:hypothetical protein
VPVQNRDVRQMSPAVQRTTAALIQPDIKFRDGLFRRETLRYGCGQLLMRDGGS